MTNARRVLISAARKHGTFLTTSLLLLLGLRPMRGGEIIATVTGIITNGGDSYAYFVQTPPTNYKRFRELKGLPFKVVFTFDDAKGKPAPACGQAASGIAGDFAAPPGTAALTINGKSREWGKAKNTHSFAGRSTAGSCAGSKISFEINDGDGYNPNIINIYLIPHPPAHSLTQTLDWRSPLTITGMDDAASGFVFGDNFHMAKAELETHQLVIEKR